MKHSKILSSKAIFPALLLVLWWAVFSCCSVYGAERWEIKKAQLGLIELGYDPGPADGLMGRRTALAIREYQRDQGLGVDGKVSQVLLRHLRNHSPVARQQRGEAPILIIDTGGHKAKIKDVIFSHDGRRLISASYDKTVRVWDVATGETLRVIRGQIGKGDEGKIFAAALSPNERWLAVGGWLPGSREESDSIRFVDFRTGQIRRLLKGHRSSINDLAFSPNSRHLLSGSFDHTARLWDVSAGKVKHVLRGHTDDIYAVAFSPDGRRLVTGSLDNSLKLWNAASGKSIATLKGHSDGVRAAAFTPDGRYLLSGSHDKSIRLWHGHSGKFIKILATQRWSITDLTISPDSKSVLTGHGASGSGIKYNNVFAIPSGERLNSFDKHENIVLATAISRDGRLSATGGGDDQEIYIWDLRTARVKQKLVGKGRRIWSVGFAENGRAIAWGKTWEKSDLYSRGPLEQSFQLREDKGFELSLGRPLRGDQGYRRGIESAGGITIRTKNGKTHPTLQILKKGRVAHQITRDSNSGFDHRSLTLTPDGRTVISGGSNGVLAAYDTGSRRQYHEFIGHAGDVWAVAVSPDGRRFVSGSSDQTVRLWEIKTGKLLLTIFQGTDNEWVAWTPEGYYTASVYGDNYIGWHINQGVDKSAQYFPAARFAQRFYAPEVVARYIETGGDLERAIRLANADRPRAKKVKTTSVAEIKQLLPPEVEILAPSRQELTVSNPEVRLRAQARALTREPITDLWVLVNGRRLDKSRGIAVVGEKKRIEGRVATLDITVPLTEAQNRIAVVAANRQAQSEPKVIRVRWQSPQPPKEELFKPNLYVLAIGISHYADSSLDLGLAHKDAQAIADVFKAQQGRLYHKVESRMLVNAHAHQDAILEGLDWILSEATQKDVAVIFIAGHGFKDQRNNYYLLPHDGDREHLRRTGVEWFHFQDVLTSLPSKTLLLADTCHSGGITGTRRRDITDMTDALRELMNTDVGVVVMTASTGREVSVEKQEWGHGAFTKAVLEGLQGQANYDRNRTIDIKELDLYVTQRVKVLTEGQQHPTTEIPKTMPNFPVVYK